MTRRAGSRIAAMVRPPPPPPPPGGSEITASVLTTDADQNTSEVTTATVAPAANRLLLAWITQTHGTETEIPVVSGLGLTWTFLTTGVRSEAGPRRISLVMAVTGGSPPTPGTLTIALTSAVTNVMWSIVEYANVDLAAAVRQTATNAADGFETSAAATLGAPPLEGSATVGGLMAGNDEAMTPGDGYTKLSEINIGVSTTGSFYQMVEFRDDPVDVADASWVTAAHWVMIGAELRRAA